MAVAVVTAQQIIQAGLEPAYAAVEADGNEFANDGQTFVQIKNSSGANSYTVTIVSQSTLSDLAVADLTVTVGTSEDWMVGPFRRDVFNDSDDNVQITYSGSAPETDLTIGVFKATWE